MTFTTLITGFAGRVLLRIGVYGLLPLCAHAQTDTTGVQADSARTRLPEIVVVGDKLSSVSSRTLLPVSVLSRSDMERTGAVQIGEALVYMPGVFIRDYGGLGGLKTVSLRGTSAAQTAVFVDGVKINSVQNGLTDLSVLPTGMVESVEVVRGGESALFGASAVGGAVNIRSLSPGEGTSLRTSVSAGSFGEVGAGGFVRLSVDSSAVLAGADYRTSQGDYPFDFSEFGTTRRVRRDNGDFTNTSAVLAWSGAPGQWVLRTHVFGRATRRGVPGAVVQGNIESLQARMEEDDALSIVHAVCQTASALSLSMTATARYNTTRYRDPGAAVFGAKGIDERFRTREASFTASLHGVLFEQLYELQGDVSTAELRGNMLQPGIGDKVYRRSAGFALRSERSLLVGKQEVVAQAAVRVDAYSDAGTALSPLVAALWRPTGVPLTVRAQGSYNFRPPSFNELYYLNFGTATLRPERSLSLHAGVEWQIIDAVHVEVSLFSIATRHRIVAVPVSPVTWSARNIDGAVARGIEVGSRCNLWHGAFQADLSYTRQQSTSQTDDAVTDGRALAYTPRDLAAATVQTRVGILQCGASAHYTGVRYSLDGESPEAQLPPYAVVGLMLGARVPVEGSTLAVWLHCDNILDTRYSVVRNYPMPGRMVRLSAEFTIGAL